MVFECVTTSPAQNPQELLQVRLIRRPLRTAPELSPASPNAEPLKEELAHRHLAAIKRDARRIGFAALSDFSSGHPENIIPCMIAAAPPTLPDFWGNIDLDGEGSVMNIREGSRRVGILLGVLGATIGFVAEDHDGMNLWTAHAANRQFDSLMSAPTMVQVSKAANVEHARDVENADLGRRVKERFPGVYGDLTNSDLGKKVRARYPDGSWEKHAKDVSPSPVQPKTDASKTGKFTPPPLSSHEGPTLPLDLPTSAPWESAPKVGFVVVIHHDGLREANVDSDGIIQSIRLEAGQVVERGEPPVVASYLKVLLYPLLGFLIPWGTIHALSWVAIGFFQSKPPTP